MIGIDLSEPRDRIVGRLLARHAERSGESAWLMSGGSTVSYAAADETVNRYANGLASLGVSHGDTVAMVMEPSIELVLAGVAATRLRGIFTPVSTDFKGPFLREALAGTRARVLVVDAPFVTRLAELSDLGPIEHVLVNAPSGRPPDEAVATARRGVSEATLESLLEHPASHPKAACEYTDVMQIWWSSGTTGKPKGIMHSHSSLLRSVDLARPFRDVREGDVSYSCTPMYLGSPWTGAIWTSLVTGTAAAIDERFSVSTFWDRTRFYGATHFMTLGAMHMYLWQAEPRADDAENPVRVALAVPMTWELIPMFKERFGIETMPQVYGQSETASGIFWAPDDGTRWKRSSMGRVAPWYQVTLMDDEDREVAVGEVGDICVRPREPHVMFSGYFHEPQMTVDAWRNCWHHTGDLARRDADGEYFFADRKKDYIRHKGRNISMVEVEDVVSAHPAVAEAAAYGVATNELESESELALVVVPVAGASLAPDELARFVNDRAPYYFVPRYIEIASEIPRTGHGRVEKFRLRERGVGEGAWDREASDFEVTR